MRFTLKVDLVAVLCGVMVLASAASAAPGGSAFSFPCENGTLTFDASSVLWPPDHKFHPYHVAYEGGAPGDVVTANALSTDGGGVEQASPVSATVPSGATGATVSVGLFAAHGKPGTDRVYVVFFSVSGSNSCGGAMLVTPPANGRPV